MLILTRTKDSKPNVETSVVMSNDSSIYVVTENSSGQNDSELIQRMDEESTISDVLSDFDWVDYAVVTISDNNLFVTVVLTVNREPSSNDANDAAYVISRYVENADILITDQNSNVIYPVSE
ncbi:MAG: hypothetical protein K2K34_02290 [Oscillospiraceae bacterium]|nr:hypothetical protein [Oscillospiraceae bacterium]